MYFVNKMYQHESLFIITLFSRGLLIRIQSVILEGMTVIGFKTMQSD